MPPEAHERFLARMGRALSGSGARRRCLDEIEDHLACRSDELIAEGLTPEAAWQQAIDEFGALETFVGLRRGIDRQLRWRWVMRYTTLTVIGSFVAIVGMMTMGPERSQFRSPPLTAQEESPLGPAADGPTVIVEAQAEGIDAQVREVLDRRVAVSFTGTYGDFIRSIVREAWSLEVYVDAPTLDDSGVTLEEPLELEFGSIRAEMLLSLALERIGAAFVMRDGILIITTPERIEENLVVRVYDCRRLLSELSAYPGSAGVAMGGGMSGMAEGGMMGGGSMAGAGGMMGSAGLPGSGQSSKGQIGGGMGAPPMMGGGGGGMPGMGGGMGMGMGMDMMPAPLSAESQLIRVVQTAVAPDSWQEMGGAGSVSGINGLLVIRQDEKVHRQVLELLRQLQSAVDSAQAEAPSGGGGAAFGAAGSDPFGGSGAGFGVAR